MLLCPIWNYSQKQMPTDQQEHSKHIQHSPPSNYSVSCFQLKDLLSWTTKNLRWFFFPPFACPTSPWIHKLSSSKMLWQSSTCLKICHSIKSIQNAAFVWKATALAFQSTSASSQGSSSPTCYLSFRTCHWLLWHWWHGELVDQKCVNGLRGPAVFKEGKKTQELRRTAHVWGLLKQW